MLYKSHQIFLERFQNYGFRPQALATCYAMAENVFAVTQGGIGIVADGATSKASLAGSTVCGNLPRPNVAGPWTNLGGNTVCVCIADLNGDDAVNGNDLGILLAAWGPCTSGECAPDLNGDSAVDGSDLGVLLSRWGPCAP